MKLNLNKNELSEYIYALESAKDIIDETEFPLTHYGISNLLDKLERE